MAPCLETWDWLTQLRGDDLLHAPLHPRHQHLNRRFHERAPQPVRAKAKRCASGDRAPGAADGDGRQLLLRVVEETRGRADKSGVQIRSRGSVDDRVGEHNRRQGEVCGCGSCAHCIPEPRVRAGLRSPDVQRVPLPSADPPLLGSYPIVTFQYSSTTLYQFSYHIR